jgi:hypothetical protein
MDRLAGDVGETTRSNIDSGDAGRSGAARTAHIVSESNKFVGGVRNGFLGDFGDAREMNGDRKDAANGEGVSGVQNESGGIG